MFQNSGRQAEIHRMDGEGAFLDKKKIGHSHAIVCSEGMHSMSYVPIFYRWTYKYIGAYTDIQ